MKSELIEAFGEDVSTIAYCWKLTRRDGVILGFTSHDRDLWVEGTVYRSKPGMMPSAVSQSSGFQVESMDVGGVLDSETITSDDLALGRWHGAKVEFMAVNWTAPGDGVLRLMAGTIGDVRQQIGARGEGSFEVELVSEMAGLSIPSAPKCAPLCRNELGDRKCGIDLDRLWIETTMTADSEGNLTVPSETEENSLFAAGRVRVLSGVLSGMDFNIVSLEGGVLVVEEEFPLEAAPCRVRMWPGCDKRFSTCAHHYGNAARFNAEPHVPGVDALIRYGGS